MKSVALAGMATLAMAGAAWADEGAGYSGFVGASHSWADAEEGGVSVDVDATTLSGAAAFDLRGRFQVQVDAQATDQENLDDPIVGGSLHFVKRTDGWMFGGFAGGAETDDVTFTVAGFEGALYFDRFTLAAALGYADSDDLDGEGVLSQIEGRFFVDRNLRLDATFTQASGGDADGTALGVGGEYKFTNSHLSVFGAYTNYSVADLDVDLVSLGVRVNLDADLAARDESGASLISAPNFGTLF
jgi:hypothetical protein